MHWSNLNTFFNSLSFFDYTVLSVNILLILFARPALVKLSSGNIAVKTLALRINLLRGLNVVIVLVYAYQYLYNPAIDDNNSIKLLSILAILYLTYLSNYLIQYFINKQYGKARDLGDKTLYIETYQSRLLSILTTIFLTIIAIIAIVQQLGFDSLLQTGGVLGFIGVFMGLTQASWAPDIISGLIILNSDMFEEGDIVELDNDLLGRVYKTKMFHTEIINITNNHRVMIRNAHLRDSTIHNLSKFASGKGLRECLSFNIGYNVSAAAVNTMLIAAFDTAIAQEITMETNPIPAVKLLETGDHAIQWGIIFHIKHVENIVTIRQDFKAIILETAIAHEISLATPITHHAT